MSLEEMSRVPVATLELALQVLCLHRHSCIVDLLQRADATYIGRTCDAPRRFPLDSERAVPFMAKLTDRAYVLSGNIRGNACKTSWSYVKQSCVANFLKVKNRLQK